MYLEKEKQKEVLTADILSDGDFLKFVTSGTIAKTKYGPKPLFTVRVNDAGEEYSYFMDTSSKDKLIDVWGADTDNWIDKEVTVERYKYKKDGQLKWGFIVHPRNDSGEISENEDFGV